MTHGILRPQEKQIMDLHDRGFRNGEIAAVLGLKPVQVKRITTRFSDEDGGFEAMVVKGTTALRRAIELRHPDKKQEISS